MVWVVTSGSVWCGYWVEVVGNCSLADETLRDVMEMCRSWSDVQARASACELLHSLLVMAVATEQQAPTKVKVSATINLEKLIL